MRQDKVRDLILLDKTHPDFEFLKLGPKDSKNQPTVPPSLFLNSSRGPVLPLSQFRPVGTIRGNAYVKETGMAQADSSALIPCNKSGSLAQETTNSHLRDGPNDPSSPLGTGIWAIAHIQKPCFALKAYGSNCGQIQEDCLDSLRPKS